jgi:hypothetical protein
VLWVCAVEVVGFSTSCAASEPVANSKNRAKHNLSVFMAFDLGARYKIFYNT